MTNQEKIAALTERIRSRKPFRARPQEGTPGPRAAPPDHGPLPSCPLCFGS